ncbi:IS1 family transposase [Rahnella bonaserana]
MPKNKHLIGQLFTQDFELNYVTLRTRFKSLSHRKFAFYSL